MALGEGTKAVIREIAREVILEHEEYLREEMSAKIHLHSIECEVKKNQKIITAVSAVIGGGIVAFVSWLLGKF
jgi:hypothetical protein